MSAKPVVLVVGGSRGIGLSVVQQLLSGTPKFQACNVVSLSRSRPTELQETEKKAGDALAVLQGDATSLQDNQRAVQEAVKRWNKLDALVLNAGIMTSKRIADEDPAGFADVLNVNTVSLISSLRAAIPELRKQKGRVVFVSSGAAIGGTAGWGAYNASKAAMNSIARTLATEEKEIASFAVRPGVVDTDMQGLIRSCEGMDPEAKNKFVTMHRENKLLPAHKPAFVLAALAVNGTREQPVANGKAIGAAGEFVSWDSNELAAFQE